MTPLPSLYRLTSRWLQATRILLLVACTVLPFGRLGGSPAECVDGRMADWEKGDVLYPCAPDSLDSTPVGMMVSVLQPSEPEFVSRPVVLSELSAQPVPRWLTAWSGETPASKPALAFSFNRTDPLAYADWLQSSLPLGCTVRREWALVTAYCPCELCCDARTGITATGRATGEHPYGIAADWRLLARGTKVHVPGYLTRQNVGAVWEVDDTGGALRRSRAHGILHLDVRFISHEWAAQWGTRKMWIYVVRGPVLPPA